MINCSIRKLRYSSTLALGAAVVGAFSAHAGPLGYGVIVERDGGTGSFGADAAAYDSNGHAIFFDEFDPTATGAQALPSQTISVPNSVSMLTNGTTTGFLSASGNGNFIVSSAFVSPVGTVSPGTSSLSRAILRLDSTGTVDTSTTFTVASAVSPRSTASVDGTTFYDVTSSTARYFATFGATNGTGTSVESHADRAAKVFQGRLFLSSTSTAVAGGAPGVFELTTSASDRTPPTATATVTTLVSITGGTPEGFTLIDTDPTRGFDGTTLDTLYVADEGTSSGLRKYTLNADQTTWTAAYTLTGGLTATTTLGGGIQDVASAGVDASGNPILFATTLGTGGRNALVRIVDSGASSSFTSVVDAPANTVFRGLTVFGTAPVPEPASATLVLAAAAGGLVRRRRRPVG